MNTSKIENISYDYLYDLTDRNNQLTYFKMKNKYENCFSSEEKIHFEKEVLENLSHNIYWQQAQLLIIPETGNDCLKSIALLSGKEVVYLKKSNKESIFKALDQQKFMKDEKIKLYESIHQMETVKIAGIAGNQRKRFVSCLFDELSLTQNQQDKNTVFFDDSIFSGFTFLASQHVLKYIPHNNIVIFNKQASMNITDNI